jgi:hypothetical protein
MTHDECATEASTPALTCHERGAVDTAANVSTYRGATMSKLGNAQDRALELIGEIGDGLRKAVPGKAMQWVETGAAIGAIKTGTRLATTFVRRNPVLATAAIAGAGLLWYAAHRRAKQAESGPIEGTATRVEAKQGQGKPRAPRRARAASTDS